MGRALLADPKLPNKAKEEHFDNIHRCIYCNNCRIGRLSPEGVESRRGAGLSCTVNPALFREKEFELKPASLPKKVMVIGGGLAGMEAARVLAERGHEVSLYEKSSELGGQWNIACSLPAKASFRTLSQHLIRELDKATVNVILKKEVTRHLVEEEKPDVIVVATGAIPLTLDVPGADGKNVVQAVEVIAGKARAGNRVVVIGGSHRGMEVAYFLAEQGKKVSLVTRSRLGGREPIERNIFVTLRERLIERGVMVFPFSPVFEIRDNGVYVVSDNELLFLTADTLVMAVGAKADNKLVEELKGVVPELYAIGDCARVRNAKEAVNEAAELGRKI
jgi:2-enoate reductase